ncbi:hypothetical protein D3C85_1591140 [compost metagenome]
MLGDQQLRPEGRSAARGDVRQEPFLLQLREVLEGRGEGFAVLAFEGAGDGKGFLGGGELASHQLAETHGGGIFEGREGIVRRGSGKTVGAPTPERILDREVGFKFLRRDEAHLDQHFADLLGGEALFLEGGF